MALPLIKVVVNNTVNRGRYFRLDEEQWHGLH